MNIKNYINEIPDFPKQGVSFKDISPLLKSTDFKHVIDLMLRSVHKPDYFVGIDSRGFIFASAMANASSCGMILCRKKGKLPPPVISHEYSLEYGADVLEIQPGTGNVVIVDDVYATGGTMNAAISLCEKAGYQVIDKIVLIDLVFLHGHTDVKSMVRYE